MTERPVTAPVPRIVLTRDEAAASLGMSLDSFERYVQPNIRMIREGRLRLFAVAHLRAWADWALDNRPHRGKARSLWRRLLDDEGRAYVAVLRHDPCSYCGESATSVDHIQPRSAGGAHDWDNLTAACGPCNSAKRDKPLLLWMAARER